MHGCFNLIDNISIIFWYFNFLYIMSHSLISLLLQESPLDSLSIQIQRNGGDLTTEQVLYRIVPSGNT